MCFWHHGVSWLMAGEKRMARRKWKSREWSWELKAETQWGGVKSLLCSLPLLFSWGEPKSYFTQSKGDFQNSRSVLDWLKNQSPKKQSRAAYCFGGWSRDGMSIRWGSGLTWGNLICEAKMIRQKWSRLWVLLPCITCYRTKNVRPGKPWEPDLILDQAPGECEFLKYSRVEGIWIYCLTGINLCTKRWDILRDSTLFFKK